MKATIDGVVYDTENYDFSASDCLSTNLYTTHDGIFFFVQMRDWDDYAHDRNDPRVAWVPSLDPYKRWPDTPDDDWQAQFWYVIIPTTRRQALEWYIKVFMPDTFKGYLLESLV